MILALVQARLSSTRLPGKVMLPILGKETLAHLLARVRWAVRVDDLMVATSTDSADDAIEHLCMREGVGCFRGSLIDVLDRCYRAASSRTRPDHVVRLTGDCPLIDPSIIDRVITAHLEEGNDYTSNINPPTFPDGLDVEILSFRALLKAWTFATLPSEREHVTLYLRNNPGKFKTGNVKSDRDLSKHRWTLDEPEDFQFVESVYEALYPTNHAFGSEAILDLLALRPDLLSINQHFTRNEGLMLSCTHDPIRRIALGTAQFGSPYGISNRRGVVPTTESADILRLASAEGITTIDTAPDYGFAERTVGNILSTMPDYRNRASVVTKCGLGAGGVEKSVRQSLERLGLRQLHGLLLHTFEVYERERSIWAQFIQARDSGLTRKIGFSVYHPWQAQRLLDDGVQFDLLQFPFSVLDQRFTSLLPQLKGAGVELHARSVFLQGVVFVPKHELHAFFQPAEASLEAIRSLGWKYGSGVAGICLAAALSIPQVDRIVIGVDGLQSFKENLKAIRQLMAKSPEPQVLTTLAIEDEQVLLPYLWPPQRTSNSDGDGSPQ